MQWYSRRRVSFEKKDHGKSPIYQYGDGSTFQPEQRTSYTPFLANGDNDEIAVGSVLQTWREQGTRSPPSDVPRNTAAAPFILQIQSIAHRSRSRGPDTLLPRESPAMIPQNVSIAAGPEGQIPEVCANRQ